LVKDDGEIIDISEIATGTIDGVVEKGTVVVDEVKSKSADVIASVKAKTAEAINKARKCDEAGSEDDDSSFSESGEEKQSDK
jgi:hypothetical protein